MHAKPPDNLSALGWVIYVLITAPVESASFFKVGATKNIGKRINALQTGCPLPIGEFLYHKALSRESAFAVERAMHEAMRDHRSSGEWFRFDVSDPEHKALFNEVLQIAGKRSPGYAWKWNRLSVSSLRRALKAVDPVLESAEERRKMRQVQRLMAGRAY